MMDAKQENVELRKEQDEINKALGETHQRLLSLIREASCLGQERHLKFANAVLQQFNKRTRGYTAALIGIADTFEEILQDARKSTGSSEGNPV